MSTMARTERKYGATSSFAMSASSLSSCAVTLSGIASPRRVALARAALGEAAERLVGRLAAGPERASAP